MKQFKVYYNDGRHHIYLNAEDETHACELFGEDTGAGSDEVWAEEVGLDLDDDFDFEVEFGMN